MSRPADRSRFTEVFTQAHVDVCVDVAVIAAEDTFSRLSRYAGTDPMAAALRAFDANFPAGATREQITQALINRAASVSEPSHVQ